MELAGFFRALPHPVLAQYRELYLWSDDAGSPSETQRSAVMGIAPAEVEQIATALAEWFGDHARVRALLASLPKSHHVALITLLHCRGVAGGTWMMQELTQSHGMSEDLWAEVMHGLGLKLLLFGNSRQSPPLFYVMPAPLQAVIGAMFQKRLCPQPVPSEGIRLSTDTNYRHPLGYSVLSFLVYLWQNDIKVTRGEEVFKRGYAELLAFFANLWGSGSEDKVLRWHLDLVQDLGLVHQRAGHLAVDDLVVGEYLALSARQRRDLLMRWFGQREDLLLWLLDELGRLEPGEWTALERLRTLYRRRYMGGIFHRRYVEKSYYLPPSGFYDPNPPLEVLQLAGLVESGLGEGGSCVRLSEDGRIFVAGEGLEAIEANPKVRFLLQPNFEILAPVGLPLQALWGLGEVAELRAVDRANTFVLTRDSVRGALDAGWRADELLGFLRDGSQIDVPQNVESTVRDWVGSHGEVELHDALVVTTKPARAKAVLRALKKARVPFEPLANGAVAVAREAREDVLAALKAAELGVAPKIRRHDRTDNPASRAGPLHSALAAELPADTSGYFPTKSLVMLGAPSAEGGREVMNSRGVRSGKRGANAVGADLSLKPAAAGAGDLLKLSPSKTISVVKAAIRLGLDVEVLYPSTGDEDPGGLGTVTPQSVKEVGGSSHFLGYHHGLDKDMEFQIKRIRGIRLAT